MKKGNIFNFFLGMVLIGTIIGCDLNKGVEQPTFSCEENANTIYQNSSLNNFEKSKFKSFASSSFKITKFGSCTGVGFISSINVLGNFEYVLSKCQPMVILIN